MRRNEEKRGGVGTLFDMIVKKLMMKNNIPKLHQEVNDFLASYFIKIQFFFLKHPLRIFENIGN